MKILPTTLFILIFCVSLFSFGARDLSLEFKGDENFYFESAKGMLETQDLVTPRYMGEERFQKPILFYWLILSSFRVFGVSWLAARLPSILFGAFLAVLIFAISNLFFKDRIIGLSAALFSATTPLYYRYARLAVPDMALVFFMTLALYYFARSYKDSGDRKARLLFFAALAFAVLIKGPVGLLVPLFIVGIFCLIKRERVFGAGSILTGLVIFALIAGPWFYLIYRIHGGSYVSHVWSREILQRLGGGYGGHFIIGYFKGLCFYISALITKFLPYSLFLPVAFINSFAVLSNRHPDRHGEGERSAHLFLILWLAVVLVFFSLIAEKRAWYLLALSPAVSILIGIAFRNAVFDKKFFLKPSFKTPYLITLIVIAIATLVFIFLGFMSGGDKISIWKFAVIIAPVTALLGFRYRNSKFMPISLALSLSILYVATALFQPFGLFMNKMERAATIIKSEINEGDRIGIGSHGIIPEELQAFFDFEFPIENVKVMYKSDGTPNLKTATHLIEFLRSKERIFCVVKRKDYDKCVPEKVKKNIYILGSYYVWKRRIRIDKELRESQSRSFREIFQNEIYVISNRE